MKGKALFLLTVFLLNTAVGFCCALHIFHEDRDEETGHHCSFSPGTKHQNWIPSSSTQLSNEDACCQRAVNDFASLAKLLPQTVKVAIQLPLALAAFYHPYILINLPDIRVKLQNFVVKRQRPPTQNIRICIQSFQI